MTMSRRVFALVLLGPVVTLSNVVRSAEAQHIELRPGQVWSIRSKDGSLAEVVVGKVAKDGNREVVHVSIIDIPNPDVAGATLIIAHVPFDEAALLASVGQLLSVERPPAEGFEEGYRRWSIDPQGGVFQQSVSDVIAAFFQSVFRRRT